MAPQARILKSPLLKNPQVSVTTQIWHSRCPTHLIPSTLPSRLRLALAMAWDLGACFHGKGRGLDRIGAVQICTEVEKAPETLGKSWSGELHGKAAVGVQRTKRVHGLPSFAVPRAESVCVPAVLLVPAHHWLRIEVTFP